MKLNLQLTEEEIQRAQDLCRSDNNKNLDLFLTDIVRNMISPEEFGGPQSLDVSTMSDDEFINSLDLGLQQVLNGNMRPVDEFLEEVFKKYK